MSGKVFRFKFRQEFMETLVSFSRIHQFDKTPEFKEAFEAFCETNRCSINEETKYLTDKGYKGDIIKKIYVSCRYYFKNKDYTPQETKKRRKYIPQDKDFIYSIDEHVEISIKKGYKPAKAFSYFSELREDVIDNEITRLKVYLNEEDEIDAKIKKTYKNRYFIQQKMNKVVPDNNTAEI